MNPAQYWALEMQNRQMQQQQQQYNQALLMQGISDMAGTYAENKAKKAKGSAYKKAFDVVGPSLGMDEDTLKQFSGQFKNDNDWYEFGETMFPSLGMVSNLRMANRNAEIREQGQQIQQDRPFLDASLKNQRDLSAGQGTYGTPRGQMPVEPNLPTGVSAPIDVAPASVAPSIPGGQASLDAINADRKRRGLPPIQ